MTENTSTLFAGASTPTVSFPEAAIAIHTLARPASTTACRYVYDLAREFFPKCLPTQLIKLSGVPYLLGTTGCGLIAAAAAYTVSQKRRLGVLEAKTLSANTPMVTETPSAFELEELRSQTGMKESFRPGSELYKLPAPSAGTFCVGVEEDGEILKVGAGVRMKVKMGNLETNVYLIPTHLLKGNRVHFIPSDKRLKELKTFATYSFDIIDKQGLGWEQDGPIDEKTEIWTEILPDVLLWKPPASVDAKIATAIGVKSITPGLLPRKSRYSATAECLQAGTASSGAIVRSICGTEVYYTGSTTHGFSGGAYSFQGKVIAMHLTGGRVNAGAYLEYIRHEITILTADTKRKPEDSAEWFMKQLKQGGSARLRRRADGYEYEDAQGQYHFLDVELVELCERKFRGDPEDVLSVGREVDQWSDHYHQDRKGRDYEDDDWVPVGHDWATEVEQYYDYEAAHNARPGPVPIRMQPITSTPARPPTKPAGHGMHVCPLCPNRRFVSKDAVRNHSKSCHSALAQRLAEPNRSAPAKIPESGNAKRSRGHRKSTASKLQNSSLPSTAPLANSTMKEAVQSYGK